MPSGSLTRFASCLTYRRNQSRKTQLNNIKGIIATTDGVGSVLCSNFPVAILPLDGEKSDTWKKIFASRIKLR